MLTFFTRTAQRQINIGQTLRVDKGEFWCPICRQLANTVLPIVPDVGPAVVRQLPATAYGLIRHVMELLLTWLADTLVGLTLLCNDV